MATMKAHPKRMKNCAYCNYWFGDANLKFINSSVGFEFTSDVKGKCSKKNINVSSNYRCNYYEPSEMAKKIP